MHIHIAGIELREPDARNMPVLKAHSNPAIQPTMEANLVFEVLFMLNLHSYLYKYILIQKKEIINR